MERIDHDLSVEAEAQLHARSSLRGKLSFYASGFYDDGGAACFRRVRELWREPHDAPRFVYMHLQETHGEYRPPHRYRKRFVPRELHKKSFAAINQRPNPHAVGLVDMTEEDFEVLRGLYDGAIAYMDEQLGALLDDLASQPGWDDTLVIITADHGDCVGRHGVLGHQFVCYEELLRIPWIVKWPRSVGILGAQSQLIQNVDLLPTLCGLLGLERPAQVESIDYLREQREFAYAELLNPLASPPSNRACTSLRRTTTAPCSPCAPSATSGTPFPTTNATSCTISIAILWKSRISWATAQSSSSTPRHDPSRPPWKPGSRAGSRPPMI